MADNAANNEQTGAGMVTNHGDRNRRAMLAEIHAISQELQCPLEVAAAIYSDERRQDNPLNRFAEVFITAIFEGASLTVSKIRAYLDEQKEIRRRKFEEDHDK